MTTMPVLGSQTAVLFPGMACEVLLATPRAVAAARAAVTATGGRIAVFTLLPWSSTNSAEFYDIGTAARIVNLGTRSCCHAWFAQLLGEQRVRRIQTLRYDPFREARIEPIDELATYDKLVPELSVAVQRAVLEWHAGRPNCPWARRASIALETSPIGRHLPGIVAALLERQPLELQQQLLEAQPLSAQLQLALAHLQALKVQMDTLGARGRFAQPSSN